MCLSLTTDSNTTNFESIFPLGTLKQTTTDWTCSERLNYTTTKVRTVIRECIPKIDLNACTSTGSFTETFLECVCTIDGCNNSVPNVEDDTTTTTTTTPATSTTLETTTTALDSGSVNMRLSSVLIRCYFFAISLLSAFEISAL